MAMTITEKILAKASGRESVRPGEIVSVRPHWIMANDATTHISIDIFENQIEAEKISVPERTVFIIDHNVPVNDIKTAEVHSKMKCFAEKQGIKNYHNGEGVCHQVLLERYALPGDIIIGADSHTCTMGAVGAFGTGMGSTDIIAAMTTGETWLRVPESIRVYCEGTFERGVFARDLILRIIGDMKSDGATYRAIEFTGPAVKNMSLGERAVLCNMAVEAGAKNGIVEADDKTLEFMKINGRDFSGEIFQSDKDAKYCNEYKYNLADIGPAVVFPHSVDNFHPVSDAVGRGIRIDQGFIGSCNNGRIENLREAADVLKGNRVKRGTKLLISPASQSIYREAAREGLMEIFIQAGATVLNPSCSSCWGGCQGILAAGENAVSTATRNFRGRTGSPDSKLYLASAATVAASCIQGTVADPREYL